MKTVVKLNGEKFVVEREHGKPATPGHSVLLSKRDWLKGGLKLLVVPFAMVEVVRREAQS
jgi:hypothetical protein